MYSLYVYLQVNYEYITQVTFTTVTLQERSKCFTREEIAFNFKLIKLRIVLITCSLEIHFNYVIVPNSSALKIYVM